MKEGLKRIPVVISVIFLMGYLAGAFAGDDRFIAHRTNGTVLDTKTALMWAAVDNGTDITWEAAKSYCENYDAGGYRDWRMPTPGELAGLYEAARTAGAQCAGEFKIHVATDFIRVTCFAAWTSETRGPDATQFSFVYGTLSPYRQSHTYGVRAIPVRTAK
ncbi:MAG: DUF1566 domain-containing protein [Deltaproteobacteria bacterium]|nr:DUF1566 domain-containing protein [Deltaproteobacteria bacterium]